MTQKTAAEWCRENGVHVGDLVDVQYDTWHTQRVIYIGKMTVVTRDDIENAEPAWGWASSLRRHVPPVVAPTAEELCDMLRHFVQLPQIAGTLIVRDAKVLIDRHDRAKRG